MTSVMLRPDFKTSGGEISDIMWRGRYVGTVTLLYREGDRVCGSIQLERHSLDEYDKEEVVTYLQDYVQSTVDAVGAAECDVVVTYSDYERIIAEKNEYGKISFGENEYFDVEEDMDSDIEWVDRDKRFEDPGLTDYDTVSMEDDEEWDEDVAVWEDTEASPPSYELVTISESRNRIDYHIYDKNQEWIAEAVMHIRGRDVNGSVAWNFDPLDDEIEHMAELLVLDFDEDEIDAFVINMTYEGELVETIELTHEDLLDESEMSDWDDLDEDDDWSLLGLDAHDEYSVVLVRDDGDMLTYEIYQQSRGGLPIGTATVDISQRQLSGFIDFREPGTEDDRELIATLLMEELDKEKEFEEINLTMLHHNQPIDEMYFETETVH